jgi:heat shock protein HtpX
MLLQEGGVKFILGLTLLLLVGIPPVLTVFSSTYQFFFGIPSYVKKLQLKVIRPTLITEKDLYNQTEKWLAQTVSDLAAKAGLPKTPMIGIYPTQEVNAFAIGPTTSYSLVVVTSGTLAHLNKNQVASIVGHEIGHILNLDTSAKTLLNVARENLNSTFLVPLSLIGVLPLSLFVFIPLLVFIPVIAILVIGVQGQWQQALWILALFASLLFLTNLPIIILGIIDALISFHSRWREFNADAVGARVTTVDSMVSALAAIENLPFLLERNNKNANNKKKDKSVKSKSERDVTSTLWIRVPMNPNTEGAFHWLYETHPPIYKRIETLRDGTYLK